MNINMEILWYIVEAGSCSVVYWNKFKDNRGDFLPFVKRKSSVFANRLIHVTISHLGHWTFAKVISAIEFEPALGCYKYNSTQHIPHVAPTLTIFHSPSWKRIFYFYREEAKKIIQNPMAIWTKKGNFSKN